MKIAILANGETREEFISKHKSTAIELIFADSLNDLLAAGGADAFFDCEFESNPERVTRLAELLPKPVFINSVTHTLDEIGQPFIRLNAWPTFLRRDICEIAAGQAEREKARLVFDALGWSFRVVPDIPGMIAARIVAMIVDEAYYTYEAGVSTKTDIDIAMKLGTNYPYGPFEWSEKIGLEKISLLLSRLSETDTRYSVSQTLLKESTSWH